MGETTCVFVVCLLRHLPHKTLVVDPLTPTLQSPDHDTVWSEVPLSLLDPKPSTGGWHWRPLIFRRPKGEGGFISPSLSGFRPLPDQDPVSVTPVATRSSEDGGRDCDWKESSVVYASYKKFASATTPFLFRRYPTASSSMTSSRVARCTPAVPRGLARDAVTAVPALRRRGRGTAGSGTFPEVGAEVPLPGLGPLVAGRFSLSRDSGAVHKRPPPLSLLPPYRHPGGGVGAEGQRVGVGCCLPFCLPACVEPCRVHSE